MPSPSGTSAIVIQGPSDNQLCLNQTMGIAAGHSDVSNQGINDFDWDFGSWSSYFQYFAFGGIGDSRPYFYLSSGAPSSQIIKIYPGNNCGTSSGYYQKTFYAVSCGGYMLVLSPNPTAGETTLSIENMDEKAQLKRVSEPVVDEDAAWQLEVYDFQKNLKLKKDKIKGTSTTIKTNGWEKGIYIVRATYKDQVLTGKLAVER